MGSIIIRTNLFSLTRAEAYFPRHFTRSASLTHLPKPRIFRQQLLDLLSGVGVVVVAGCGGNSADVDVTGPGAATRAIGVSTADIHNTVDRGNDTATFVKGPRANDGDQDQLDELKPEVIMKHPG